ncbi:MAG: type II secretion system F family protein [Gemmatimonadales bacterium]
MSMTVLGALRRLDESRFRAELFRAWATGLAAGFTHAVSLDQAGRSDSGGTEELRRYLLVGTQQGRAVGALVKARPKLFEPFEAAILAAGDEAGTLDQSLRLLADHHAREYKRMLKVRMLMGYPVFFLVVASFFVAHPFLVRGGWKVYLGAIAATLVLGMLLGGVVLSVFASLASSGAAYTLPRFVRALVTGIEAGLPLGRTVRLAVDCSGDSVIRAHVAKRSERDLATTPLVKLFEGCRSIPPGLISQMSVADATGDYANTLRRYAESLEEGLR